MADEDSLRKSPSKVKKRTKRTTVTNIGAIILSIVELALGLICLGLLRYYNLLIIDLPRFFLGVVTTGGLVLISGVFLIGSFMNSRNGNLFLQQAVIYVLGTALYIATGSVSIDLYTRLWERLEVTRVGLVFGALCISNGFIYLLHAILALRQHRESEDKYDDDY